MDSERDTHLRRLLVATAEVAPAVRPRPTRRVLAAGLTAFVLAGALTGGAVAAVGIPNSFDDSAALVNFATVALGTGGTLVGDAQSFTGQGRTELTIPPAPHDGDRLIIVTTCDPDATLTARLDHDLIVHGDCHGSGSAIRSVSRTSAHSLVASAPTGQNFAVWASWFRDLPKPVSSEQQEYDLSDGIVTRDEYVAAYGRFAGCMAEAGFPLPPVDVNITEVLSYSISSSDASAFVADERCYRREFWDEDAAWQSNHGH